MFPFFPNEETHQITVRQEWVCPLDVVEQMESESETVTLVRLALISIITVSSPFLRFLKIISTLRGSSPHVKPPQEDTKSHVP